MRPLPQYCRSDITEASDTRQQFCVILNVFGKTFFLEQFLAIKVGSLEVNFGLFFDLNILKSHSRR